MRTAKETLESTPWLTDINIDGIGYVMKVDALTAMQVYAKEACAAQREICLNNASLDTDGQERINKDSILNAPEPNLE